ncbi:MAG: hypothetical protein R2856_32100 [Caldilineaceae bacterium]
MGLSVANVVTQEMVRSMAASPIVFAMANPDPKSPTTTPSPPLATVIMGTGRSDYPNQVNNGNRLPLHLPRRDGRARSGHQHWR